MTSGRERRNGSFARIDIVGTDPPSIDKSISRTSRGRSAAREPAGRLTRAKVMARGNEYESRTLD